MIEEVYNEIKIITAQKEAELPSISPDVIDHPVQLEEIEDGLYVIEAYEADIPMEEKLERMGRIMDGTTSRRIYDTLGKLFPGRHIPAKPLAEV